MQTFIQTNIIQLEIDGMILMVYTHTRDVHTMDILFIVSLLLNFINHTLYDEFNFMEYDIHLYIKICKKDCELYHITLINICLIK